MHEPPRNLKSRTANGLRIAWLVVRVLVLQSAICAAAALPPLLAATITMRLAGARIGRRVYVNSLSLSDYNLLELGDDVVIGADAHVAGHTVERGVVKTGGVRLGRGVVVGIDSIIEIGVEAGDGCQIGALSFVPKYAKLASNSVYGGIPVRLLSHEQQARVPQRQPG
jgi:acetyltransferase-like isoleucine patch superfamily enzyme